MDLNASTLGDIRGGGAAALINKHIAAALKDCQDAPSIDKPRKVIINLMLKPEINTATGELDYVSASVAASHKTPVRETRAEHLKAKFEDDGTVNVLFPDVFETPMFGNES